MNEEKSNDQQTKRVSENKKTTKKHWKKPNLSQLNTDQTRANAGTGADGGRGPRTLS